MNMNLALFWGWLIYLLLNVVGVNACKPQSGQEKSKLEHGHGERPVSVPPPTPSLRATDGATRASPATDVEETRKGSKFYPSSHPKWAMSISIGRRRRDLDVNNK